MPRPLPAPRSWQAVGNQTPAWQGLGRGSVPRGKGLPTSLPQTATDCPGSSQAPPKTSQWPLSHRPACSQRGQRSGYFRPRQGTVVPASQEARGLPGLMGTQPGAWQRAGEDSSRGRLSSGICMQVQAPNMSWNPSPENKTLREPASEDKRLQAQGKGSPAC